MDNFCSDRDLLGLEPQIFLGGGQPALTLATGTNGVLAGTSFTSSGASFQAAGVTAGMVLVINQASGAQLACEIIEVVGPTSLSISLLRPDASSQPLAPPAGTSLSFRIHSFALQIHRVSAALADKLRQVREAAGVKSADFCDSWQLRLATALGTLADVFVSRAADAGAADANWSKAEHYRRQFDQAQLQLRLAVDTDGDGLAEHTRTLGNVVLRRS